MVRGLIFQWLITESNPSLVAPVIERPLVIERGHLTESTKSNTLETTSAILNRG